MGRFLEVTMEIVIDILIAMYLTLVQLILPILALVTCCYYFYILKFKYQEFLEDKYLREHDLLIKLLTVNYLKSDLIVTIRKNNDELVLVFTNNTTMEITEHHVKIENQELSVLKPA